jgi:hypothetical protein
MERLLLLAGNLVILLVVITLIGIAVLLATAAAR